MKRLLAVLVVLLGLLAANAAMAQDGNQPEDPDENACYEGGDLEGKCNWPTDAEDEWAWNCGWYYAAWRNAEIGAAPEWCSMLFPDAAELPSYLPLCVVPSQARDIPIQSVLLLNAPNQAGNARIYAIPRIAAEPCDSQFEVDVASIWLQTASAVTFDRAIGMCADALGTKAVDAFDVQHPDLPAFNFVCYEVAV